MSSNQQEDVNFPWKWMRLSERDGALRASWFGALTTTGKDSFGVPLWLDYHKEVPVQWIHAPEILKQGWSDCRVLRLDDTGVSRCEFMKNISLMDLSEITHLSVYGYELNFVDLVEILNKIENINHVSVERLDWSLVSWDDLIKCGAKFWSFSGLESRCIDNLLRSSFALQILGLGLCECQMVEVDGFGEIHNIEHIYIRGGEYSADAARAIFSALREDILSVSVSSCDDRSEIVDMMCESHIRPRHLMIHGVRNEHLDILHRERWALNLKTIDMVYGGKDDVDEQVLNKFLADMSDLTKVRLDVKDINENSLPQILNSSPNIKVLDVRSSQSAFVKLLYSFFRGDSQGLEEIRLGSVSGQQLDLGWIGSIGTLFSWSSLRILDLSFTGVSGDLFCHLGSGLLPVLETLNLEGCPIYKVKLEHQIRFPSLRHLWLGSTYLAVDMPERLWSSEGLPRLESLNLCRTSMSEGDAFALANVSANLSVLDLGFVFWPGSGFDTLFRACSESIVDLTFGWGGTSDEPVRHMLNQRWPNLRRLNISECCVSIVYFEDLMNMVVRGLRILDVCVEPGADFWAVLDSIGRLDVLSQLDCITLFGEFSVEYEDALEILNLYDFGVKVSLG